MIEKKSGILANIVKVLVSNITTIIAGFIIGFIIPKVISVEGYGFYKTFTLYVTYSGMFSLGIIDGIVLDYGGLDYCEYDKPLFRSYFKWYILIHFFWIAVLGVISIIFQDRDYSFIIIMIAAYMFFANIVGYFQQISQITQRFREYSLAKIIQSTMTVLNGVFMIAIYFVIDDMVDYRIYIVLTTLSFVFVACGYFGIYKDIIFGEYNPLNDTLPNILHLSYIGFPLMFANLCGTLILTLDRQFVNILFSNSEYAIYAFAYNLLALIMVATAAISTVLYPILKRATFDDLQKRYPQLISIILVFVFSALVVYFPLCKFVIWFLPKYQGSLLIFRIILPGLAASSAITVVMHNYYKTLGDNFLFFKRSVLILILSAAANYLAYWIRGTMVAISAASIITMMIWYLYIEQYFVKNYGYSRGQNLLYMLFMMISFYFVSAVDNWIGGTAIYVVVYLVVTYLLEKEVFLGVVRKLKNMIP